MSNLETRLEKLEQTKRYAASRVFSDAELAVRCIWMIDTKAPGWERVAELLAEAAKKMNAAKVGQIPTSNSA